MARNTLPSQPPRTPASQPADGRPRLLAFGVRRLHSLLQELAPQYADRAAIEVLELGFGDAVAEVRTRLAHPRPGLQAEVLVAAGSNGAYLRSHLDLPVALVKVSGFDVMRALSHARRLTRRIAFITYQQAPEPWRSFDEVFGLDITHRTYRDEDDARACVQELKDQGIEAVVGPGLVADLASEAGLHGIFLYSDDAVREALDDAVEIARIGRIEAARRERLNTILGQLKDGVVAVDMQERIETLNPAMAHLLGADAGTLLGRRLSDVAPELSLATTLRDARTETEAIQRLGHRMLVTSRLPIVEQGVQTGAVLACQDPAAIQRADRHLRSQRTHQPRPTATRYGLDDIAGSSATIARARDLARRCAASDATVLVVGESGTGKELLAQGIHRASRRAAQPFIAVNCAAFPESLLESELFGYEEGAFTGSRRGGKAGLFEAAHTGTIFLDEVGEMPVPLQTRLLRVLQEREILRIGATEPTAIDVRVIAATHRDLAAEVERADGSFRRDLYYRLNILRLSLPPLRERREDIAELAGTLLSKVAARLRIDPAGARPLVDALVEASTHYAWPGNVRELENLIERLVVAGDQALAGKRGARAALLDLAPELLDAAPAAKTAPTPPDTLRNHRAQEERERILAVLAECGGDRAAACARLGIGRTTLWRKLKGQGAA
ncbi:MAG: propionate catabolism operon regulatory protein PrpR [Aquabacterium sp.]|nr:MAG: propionate catabolism operon regulatory protein PrpR [Aquabacterium sp.]